MKALFFFLLSFVFFLESKAQTKLPQRHVDLTLKPEEENLDVFHDWIHYGNPGAFLIDHLNTLARKHYEMRDAEISKLRDRSDWIERQILVKKRLMDIVGPFPAKTPLNAKVTGTIKKKDYRVEKIVYESMAGMYVTGCLFIPDGIKGKVPAILNLIGHEQESFRAELDQVINLNLVKKGMIVFTIDPPGQGEHVQYFDPAINLSAIGYSVIEHCYFGNQCFLSGSSAARYFIWDGIRAIDYLVSRKEVDGNRIGVTGFSGGGTVTSYLGAFDERVKVAIPSSWSTASRRQLETKGAQDAEAELLNGLKNGITFEDLIEVRAPKPTLMTFTSRDEYLSLQAARDALHEARRAFSAFDKPENIELVEDDFRHWLTPKIRLAIYSFFMKHLDVKGDPAEVDVELLTSDELKVTPTGQVSTSLGGRMIFDVNKEDSERLMKDLVLSRADLTRHLADVMPKAKKVSGLMEAAIDTVSETFINGRYQREGYTVALHAIKGEGNYALPLLLFVPDERREKTPAVIYLHPLGKSAEATAGGEIEQIVRQGFIVAAVDPLGVGEVKNTASRALATGYAGVLIGRSVVGLQATDIVRVARYLRSHTDVDEKRIGAIAKEGMCIPLIHAAAFEPVINNVTLIGSLISYRAVAMNRRYRVGLTINKPGDNWHPYEVDFDWGIGGVLTTYDLPDLIASLAPRKVAMSGIKDHNLEQASDDLIKEDMEFPKTVYAAKNTSQNLRISQSNENIITTLKWCFDAP